jgi:RNA polymerase sigma-70 factor (ECF subfamily)
MCSVFCLEIRSWRWFGTFGTVLDDDFRGGIEMTNTETLDLSVLGGLVAADIEDLGTTEIGKLEKVGNASDIELARSATSGDMSAFEELYQRHHRRVYSICLRMLQSPSEAEDLTQDVFIQLYRKIGSFRGDSAFTTWLHRMTVNQVLMHFRKRTVKFEKTTEEGETPVQIVNGTENHRKMPIVDKIALENAIAQLPDGYKSVFVLHDVEGYEHEEVARILGCSVGTSKSQLHKARLKLRKLLQKKTNPRLVW